MAEQVKLVAPHDVDRNPENPRLIFRQDELDALAESIKRQGILVPLTLYQDGKKYKILDGERRWRCALKLGLPSIPAILMDKPDRLRNLMMMFAIHHRRNEWDPLPTAEKLKVLEEIYIARYGRKPTERELAELASLKIGEVRRLKKLLSLPQEDRAMLMAELQKPRSEQRLSVDHVLEAHAGASALRKKGVLNESEEIALRNQIVEKFKSGVIENTVAPRKLSRIARAVAREDISLATARRAALKLAQDNTYSVEQAFNDTAAAQEFQHGVEGLAQRLLEKLDELNSREIEAGDQLRNTLKRLRSAINSVR